MEIEFEEPEQKRNYVIKKKSEETKKARARRKKNKILKREQQRKEHERLAEKEKELMNLKVEEGDLFKMYLTNNLTEETIRIEKLIAKRNEQKGQKNEKKKITYTLEEDEEDLPKDDFHNTYESKEIRDCYSNLNYGDYFLSFPNPDHESTFNRSVTFVEAMYAYDKMLNVDSTVVKKEILHKERNAFKEAFFSLDDYDPDEAEEDENDKIAGDMKPGSSVQKTKKQIKEEKRKAMMDKKKKLMLEKENEQMMKQIEKKNLKANPEGEMNKEVKMYSNIKKKFCRGGFLLKRKIGEEVDDFEWVCTNSHPKDFLTLIRFSIITILTQKASMHCRQFIAQGGSKIIVIIQVNEKILKNIANDVEFSKQLELGATDIFSLEPVDKNYRPLRLKAFLNDQEIVKEIQSQKQEDTKDPLTIETKAKSIFQNIRKMEEPDLQVEVTRIKLKVDKWLSKLQKQLKIDLPQQKEILDDQEVDRQVWETYYIYLNYLDDYFKRIDNLRKALDPIFRIQEKIQKEALLQGKDPSQIKLNPDIIQNSKKKDEFEPIRNNLFFIYRLIFCKAIGDSNIIHGKFYSSFFTKVKRWFTGGKNEVLRNFWQIYGLTPSPPYIGYFSSTKSSESIWRRYEINERGDRSIFSNMERIKLTNAILLLHLNIFKLIQNKYLESYSPIHDNYQKEGTIKDPLFKPLFDNKFIVKKELSIGEKKLKDIFVSLSEHAEQVDFDTDGNSLIDDVKFHLFQPWSLDIASMRNYFGEKIALYFLFLSFYTKGMLVMVLAGFITQIIAWSDVTDDTFTGVTIAFSIINIVWSTIFLEKWKSEQSKFALEYGQKESQEDSAVRPGFDGVYIRSIDNDQLNEEYYSSRKRKAKMAFSYFISFILICGCITCVILCLFFRDYAKNNDWPNLLSNVLPSIMNSVQIFVFNTLYQTVALICNDFENHKYLTTYENSFIFKNFSFTFANTFNSFIIIAFLSFLFPALPICLFNDVVDCFSTLELQVRTIFIVMFVKNIPELVVPLLKSFIKKIQRRGDKIPVNHPFIEIDSIIDNEFTLEPYVTNLEIDGTVSDYMELIVQFGFLNMFCVAFPFSYPMAFANNVLEILVDKTKLMHMTRRPIPNNAADIGTWYIILDFISFISIFVNAGIICFTLDTLDLKRRYLAFTVLVIGFLALKYIFRVLIPDISEKTLTLQKRHSSVEERVVKGFKRRSQGIIKNEKVNMQIDGVSIVTEEIMHKVSKRNSIRMLEELNSSDKKNTRRLSNPNIKPQGSAQK